MHGSKIFVLLVIVGVTAATPKWHTASDGKKYLIEDALEYNWFEAYEECSKHKMQLLEIHTAEKNNIIVELLKPLFGKGHNLWLGSNDEYSTSTDRNRPFIWSTSGNVMKFSYWQPGEPNNHDGTNHCTHIWDVSKTQFKWNDINCDIFKMGFICEEHNVHSIFLQRLDDKRRHIANVTKASFESYKAELKREMSRLESNALSYQVAKKELVDILDQEHGKGVSEIGKHVTKHQEDITKAVDDAIKPIRVLDVNMKTAVEKSYDQFNAEFDKTQAAVDSTLKWKTQTIATE